MSEEINNLIDNCILLKTHYDISIISHKILKDKYKYNGNKLWNYYDVNEKLWKEDNKNQNLILDIKTIVCNYFINRSRFWNEKSLIDNNHEDKKKSISLLQLSLKLKDDKFIVKIISELKQFYIDIDN